MTRKRRQGYRKPIELHRLLNQPILRNSEIPALDWWLSFVNMTIPFIQTFKTLDVPLPLHDQSEKSNKFVFGAHWKLCLARSERSAFF